MSASGRMSSAWDGPLAISTDHKWRFAAPSEADFEPLLALRIEVMREHLERVFRYKPSRARRIFRQHFDEPGMRLILLDSEGAGDERIGCVGFRDEPECLKIDSFYLEHGRFPDNSEGLRVLVPQFVKELQNDPWGRPYQYVQPGKKGPYDIISYGADGREGGSGADQDLTNSDVEQTQAVKKNP